MLLQAAQLAPRTRLRGGWCALMSAPRQTRQGRVGGVEFFIIQSIYRRQARDLFDYRDTFSATHGLRHSCDNVLQIALRLTDLYEIRESDGSTIIYGQ